MEEKIVMENPKKLVIGDNSRWRADGNLSELMQSIKQNGILQPIVARTEDKLVICGNRRLASAIKLDWELVPVRYMKGISDKQVVILNLLENMQRKDISSIEIGRTVDNMLKEKRFKMSISELATALGISEGRIKVCLIAYKRLPPKFRESVVHSTVTSHKKIGELPENVVFSILQFPVSFKKLSDDELDYFLEKARSLPLTISQINLIGHLVITGMPLKRAIREVNDYSIARVDLICLKTELKDAMRKEETKSKHDFFKTVVNKVYPNLVF